MKSKIAKAKRLTEHLFEKNKAMDNTFTIEAIKETATYKELVSKKEMVKINILEQRDVRKRITHAFKVWENTGHIPTTLNYTELEVVNDLILMRNN